MIEILGVSNGFALLLVVTAVVSAVFAGLAWRKRGEPGGTPLVAFNLIIAAAMLAYAGDIVSTERSTQVLFLSIWFPLQILVAITWLYTAVEYAGETEWLTRRRVAVLYAEPAAVLGLITIPATRSLLYELPESGVEGSIFFAGATSGPLLPLHLGFLYVLITTGTFLYVRLFVRSKHLYRTETVSLVVAAVAPWTVVLIQSNNIAPVEDPSAVAFAVSGMALTAGLYRFGNLDPVPAAREAIVTEMGDGVIVLDTDGMVGSVNPAARALFGEQVAETDLVGTPINALFPDWDRLDDAPASDADPTDWQELSVSVDGDERVLEIQRSSFQDRFDRPIGQLIVMRDITDRTRREQNLARYKTIFESVTDRVYVLDDDGRFLMANEPFASFVGVDPAELRGRPFDSVVPTGSEPDGGAVPPAGESRELTVETADGERIPCEIRHAGISFDGLETGAVGILRDISRRRQIESSLAQTTERLDTLVDASPLAIIVTDRDGVVDVWNPAAMELFGWTAEEVVGEPIPIIPDDEMERAVDQHERVFDGESIRGFEAELQRKDGSRLDVSFSSAPIRDGAGDVVRIVSVISDISERKEREAALRRKNARLDEFAGIVSHDLRNPLSVATGAIELAAHEADESVAERLDTASDALDRMEGLIDHTLKLAREGEDIDDPTSVSLPAVFDRAWELAPTDDVQRELAEPPETVSGDPERLRELFANLLRNTAEHATGPAEADGSGVTVTLGGIDDGFYLADDGPGIPESDRASVLESGYSTAEGGTGFGLAIVQTIAEAHGWTVTVTESESGGARFEFTGVDSV